MAESNPELERFRREWQEEVTARTKGKGRSIKQQAGSKAGGSAPGVGKSDAGLEPPAPSAHTSFKKKDAGNASEHAGHHGTRDTGQIRATTEPEQELDSGGGEKDEPRLALEHYERAVEQEKQGNLGDSLAHYRKAYRLDSSVEKLYKKKHINAPVGSTKASDLNPSGAPVTVPNTAHHSLHGPPLPSISELISSFSTLSIPPSDAPTATSDAPPSSCPIATLPSEVLVEILFQLALLDMAAFTRLAQVCKRLAFLVATEDRIWKRLCCGWEVGFGGMHYSWACDLAGRPVFNECSEPNSHIRRPPTYVPVPLTPIYPTYQLNLRRRPRIRFNGCYISTVNYVRPGATSVSQVSWNTPVHIVTYYRYLRFFRDGTVISLLSTAEPIDVVHHLTKENLANLNNPTTPTPLLPSTANTLRPALRGRWKLHGHPLLLLHASNSEGFQHHHRIEGDLTIETEGVDPRKYLYLMHLSLRTSSSVKNNNNNKKLIWRGYWSVNRLTHDLDEFGPRDARPFFWSRVGSYGAG